MAFSVTLLKFSGGVASPLLTLSHVSAGSTNMLLFSNFIYIRKTKDLHVVTFF